MHKVILDANVILSGILYGGTPALLLEGMQDKRFMVCISQDVYDEVFDKLIHKFQVGKGILRNVEELLSNAIVYNSTQPVSFHHDPDDAYLLALAEESKADYLVSGDKKHLLPLKNWKNTQIISPKQAKHILLK